MILIVDEAISSAEEAFSLFGEVRLYQGRAITNEILKNADALIIRSVTEVNESLLKGTNIRFVGTATIGMDHIDTAYLQRNGIAFAGAEGCNADAVTEYVFTSMLELVVRHNLKLADMSIGIIGCGNIGSRVLRVLKSAGLSTIVNDPPLQRKLKSANFDSLEKALGCDIVTLHVPLNLGGIDNTYHLIGENEISIIKQGSIIINAARGPVVDNRALLKGIINKKIKAVLDVWENEPYLNTELLSRTELATPHIAGYSFEGKVNGTKMIFEALKRHLKSSAEWSPRLPHVEDAVIKIPKNLTFEETLNQVFNGVYDLKKDDVLMRKMETLSAEEVPVYFDTLRKEYPLRREFNNYTVKASAYDQPVVNTLRSLRFNITD